MFMIFAIYKHNGDMSSHSSTLGTMLFRTVKQSTVFDCCTHLAKYNYQKELYLKVTIRDQNYALLDDKFHQ